MYINQNITEKILWSQVSKYFKKLFWIELSLQLWLLCNWSRGTNSHCFQGFWESYSSGIQSWSTLLRDNFSVILICSNLYFYRVTFSGPMRLSYINVYCKTLVYSSLSIRIYWHSIIFLIFTSVLCSNCFFLSCSFLKGINYITAFLYIPLMLKLRSLIVNKTEFGYKS